MNALTEFAPLASQVEDRLIISGWGEAKSGKTHFALTCPEPIFFLNFDYGVVELASRFSGKDIRVANIFLPEEFTLDSYAPLLARFDRAYKAALASCPPGGTVAVDTATQVWQLVSAVKVEEVRARREEAAKKRGKELKELQTDWGEANLAMGAYLRRAHQVPGVNVVWIHRSKPEYTDGGQPTGRQLFQGYKETPYIAQLSLQFRLVGTTPQAIIEHSRHNKDLTGMTLAEPTYDLVRAIVLGDN